MPLTGDFVRAFIFWLKIGASRFEFEPTPTFSCSSQMELAWSHDRRMFLDPDTVGGVEIPARKSGRGIVLRKGIKPRIRLLWNREWAGRLT